MAKIKLLPRKSVEIDVGEDEPVLITFFEKTGKQFKKEGDALKANISFYEFRNIQAEHLWDNIKADEDVIKTLKDHFEENGGLQDFINSCEEALGKQKKSA